MNFNTKPYSKRIDKPWGYEIKLTPENFEHTGKILFIEGGKRFSFQYHDQKEEALCLFSGKARIWIENDQGEIEKKLMEINRGYVIKAGQKHRIEAVEDSFVFEVSGPEIGTTYRLEDDYQRDNEEK